MEDSDSEYELEETVVLVELNGIIDADLLLQQQSLTKILGIDTDEPILQIGNCLFKGQYEDTLGTVVVYEPEDDCQKDGSESSETGFKFLCKTDTKLTMKRCFPQEKIMDSLKSTEVSPPVAIQNKQEIPVVDSEITSHKKKTISMKNKPAKPIPHKLQKPKKNIQCDLMTSFEKQNEEILKSPEQLIENTPDMIGDAVHNQIDAISSEGDKGYQISSAHSESVESQIDKKKTEVFKKRRKRNHDDVISPNENIKDSTTLKKLMKIKEDEIQVADKKTVTSSNENRELNKSDNEKITILSDIGAFVAEIHSTDEQMVEEKTIVEALVSAVTSNECKIKSNSAKKFASEMDKGKLHEEITIRTSENIIINNDLETSAVLERKKKTLIDKEYISTTLDELADYNKSDIQEKHLFTNLPELDKESGIEEGIVETSDNTTQCNERKIQEISTFANVSEIGKEPVLQERIIRTLGNIKMYNESEIPEESTFTNISEIGNESVIDEKGIIHISNNTKVCNESEIQEKITFANISEIDNETVVKKEGIEELSNIMVISNESAILEKSTFANISKIDKGPVIEERIVETSDNELLCNEFELQEKVSFINVLKIDNEPVIGKEIILQTPDNTLVCNKTEIQDNSKFANTLEIQKEPVVEKRMLETLDDTLICKESEIQDENTFANSSELDQEPVLEEKRIKKTSDNTLLCNESKSQDTNAFVNVSEIDKESLLEEKNLETHDFISVGNECEKQEKCILNSASEFKKVFPAIEKDISKTMENIVDNIDNKFQQEHIPMPQLEIDQNDEFVRDEVNVVKALDDTVTKNKSVTDKGNTSLNIPDDGTSVSSAEVTRKTSLVFRIGNVKDNDNCSSSSDMKHTENENFSEETDVCESSDDTNNAHLENKDNIVSLFCQENEESMLLEKTAVKESNVGKTVLNTESDNLVGFKSLEKDTICVASQSANIEQGVSKKLKEFEGQYISSSSASELVLNRVDNLNPVFAPDMSSPSMVEETFASNTRKHSSCEVTQSTNFEVEYLGNKDLVNEYEVFSEPRQDDNLENVTIELSEKLQATEVKFSDTHSKSCSISSEIVHSCQERIGESSEFEADGGICNQSINQSDMLPAVQNRSEDSCISSCDIDSKSESNENCEKDKYFNSKKDTENSICEKNETSIVCEVSQSDESENIIPNLSESSESEAKMSSKECEGSFSGVNENLDNDTTKQHTCEIIGNIQEVINIPSTSSIQEVTQSCSIKEIKNSDSIPEKSTIKEFSKDETHSASTELCDDKLKSDSISSVSETLLEIKADTGEKSPNSEVSQSFEALENQQFNKPMEASYLKAVKELKVQEINTEFKHSSEVNQSAELESSASQSSQQFIINECHRSELYSNSMQSVSNLSIESHSEICESTADISNIESNSHIEVQPVKYSICEVSQSSRSEDIILITDSEMESSNECEVYAICVEPVSETDQQYISDKNICESSNDVIEIESETYIDQFNEPQKNICESSDDVNETESEIIIDRINKRERNICESSDDINETEYEIIVDQISDSRKNICESSDVNETKAEIIIGKICDGAQNICESSGDVTELKSENIIDPISKGEQNICESSGDITEIESEKIIDPISDSGKNICESSDDVNETESEIGIDKISEREQNICESSDDINETGSVIIVDKISDSGKNICESSDDVNETECKIILDAINEKEKNLCESSDDISENFKTTQQHGSIHLGDISDEACQSSKSDENVLSDSRTEILESEENFPKCKTSSGRSNIKKLTTCESSDATISMESNDQELNADACTSSDKSLIDLSDAAVNLLDNESSVSVGEMENNQISQSSNVASACMDLTVNGTGNGMISQSGTSVNVSIYKQLNEPENCQISQSGGILEDISITETEGEISQSVGVTGCSNIVPLNEVENNQISQSGCVINSLSTVDVEETENEQISQSENTVGCYISDSFVTETENNQISQSGNNENPSSEITLNDTENSQISQSGNVASYSADMSITETENSLISQSGSVPGYSGDISRNENDNSQISQSNNSKDFLYKISVNESDNNQISQSSCSLNLSGNAISREIENNQISQSGNSTGIVCETENNQISQSSSAGGSLSRESENCQISQSSNSCTPSNVLSSNEINNQISQSECNDNIYELNETVPSGTPFQTEVVNISSSSDIVSSNYIDVTNSSFHVSNSAISSNSEVSPSLGSIHAHILDRNSLVTSVTTSEMRTSVLSSEQGNEIESQSSQGTAHLAVSSCSAINAENQDNVAFIDQEIASSNNINEVVESSLSLVHTENELNTLVSKDESPMSISEEMPSTSQNLKQTDDNIIQNTETDSTKTNTSSENLQSNSLLQTQFEFNTNLLQTSFLPCVSSQTDFENNSSSVRPSFLEVMASSASDFRNSLLSDSNFSKDKSHISAAPESSGSNIGSCGEFSESFIREADGLVKNKSNDSASHIPENLPALTDHTDSVYSEMTRSSNVKKKYNDNGEFGYSHHQVSQSSDVVNTLSSTSKTPALISDNISQPSQQDFVQSSSNILRTSVLISNESVSLIDQVSSADENTSFVSKDSENVNISESSIGVEAALPSCSQNTFSLANPNQLIESSCDQPTFTEDVSSFKPENAESEVSSTPSETQYTGFKVLIERKEQLSSLQGNILILPGTSKIIDESGVDIRTVEVTSPDSDYAPIRSDHNSQNVLVLDTSNEAEILNRSSIPELTPTQLGSFNRGCLSVDASQVRFASSASGSPISEIEVVSFEEGSEVSESLVTNPNDISQSSLGDNNVSCSVSEFSTSHRITNTSCSFPDISQEAESKSSDDCISSYHHNILPVPNLQSSADREFYSHVGEFDDSVQSSLDETHLAINEQIKAISSPPNSSDSTSCEEQRSLSINPFVTFSSQSHVFSTNFGASSSKITCSNAASEIELDRDNLIENSPQLITTTSNSDVIISSFDPELTNMSHSPQNSGNACSPEQYVELSEQIVPAIQMAGADFVESSNDQLDDSELVDNSVSQNDVLNIDSES